MNNMLMEMICAIPENVGWVIVGVLSAFTWMMGWKLGKCIYTAIKEWRECEAECEG